MSIIEAIFLGIVQGATEFLPVSSTGHTILIPALLGLPAPELDFIAIAHQGTLLAVLVYFWQDLWRIFMGMLDGLRRRAPLADADSRLGWYIILATIPAAAAGLLLEDFFEELFLKPVYVAGFLLVTALVLVTGERMLSGDLELEKIDGLDALAVGIFQMIALLPGVSRSGSTITGGLWRGLDREAAARFSFLLGIPAIAGAGLVAVIDAVGSGLSEQAGIYIATFLTAAITGYLCIHFLLTWLRSRSLYLFAGYCAVFALFYLAMALVGVV